MNYIENYWSVCLENIEKTVSPLSFKTWFNDIVPLKITDYEFILQVPDQLTLDHVNNDNYLTIISSSLKENFNKIVKISFVLKDDQKFLNNLYNNDFNKRLNNFNNSYIFENFVIGESNRLAHAASVAVAESPGIYNPLFLYGDVGLGKTHLMHAIANFISEKNPDSKVLYASCEKFTNELISSIKEQKNKEFREKYRKIDVLLIDDIQFIVDKTQTQEEFFHTFNDLKDSGKQIIISSDRPPNEIETLTERLRSRFAGGLIADIKTPNFETRTAILEKKAESLNIPLSKEVSQFIAKSVKSNIRELEGALTRVVAYSNLTKVPISISLAESALKDIVSETENSLTLNYILEIVSDYFNIKIDDIKSKKRNKNITTSRQVYMYLAREILDEPLLNIGKSINRDHSTVIHGIEKIQEKLKVDSNFQNTISSLKEKIIKK